VGIGQGEDPEEEKAVSRWKRPKKKTKTHEGPNLSGSGEVRRSNPSPTLWAGKRPERTERGTREKENILDRAARKDGRHKGLRQPVRYGGKKRKNSTKPKPHQGRSRRVPKKKKSVGNEPGTWKENWWRAGQTVRPVRGGEAPGGNRKGAPSRTEANNAGAKKTPIQRFPRGKEPRGMEVVTTTGARKRT